MDIGTLAFMRPNHCYSYLKSCRIQQINVVGAASPEREFGEWIMHVSIVSLSKTQTLQSGTSMKLYLEILIFPAIEVDHLNSADESITMAK